MNRHLVLLVLGICLFAGVSQAHALELVTKGKVVGEIVLPPSPSTAETFVANDFQHWVEQITGVKVPVLTKPSSDKNTKLMIGRGLASQWKSELQALAGTDGYAIRHKGNEVYVFGDLPRGTAYGLYHLLETSTDIIWARPNATFGTIFTRSDTLALNPADSLSKPAFALRGWNVAGVRRDRDTGIWVWRNGGNHADQTLTDDLQMLVMPHYSFLGTMAPVNLKDESGKNLFERHPEYYSFDAAHGGRYPASLCMTNPDLPAEAAKNVIKRIQSLPQLPDYVRMSMSDTWVVCQCDECVKPIKLADGKWLKMKSPIAERDPTFHSTRYFMFMNKVAADVRKVYPNIKLLTLAYFYGAESPLCELDPAILPLFCPVGGKNPRYPMNDPNQNPVWRVRYNTWLKQYGSRLGVYEYYFGVNEPSVGFGMAKTTIAPDLRALKAAGGVGIYPELMPDVERKFRIKLRRVWDASGLSAWVIAKLFWDPAQDVTSLRNEYIHRVYHEAEEPIKTFYDLIEQSWDSQTHSYKNRGEMFKSMIVDRGIEAACNAALDKAQELVVNPHAKEILASLKREWVDYSQSLSRNNVPELTLEESKELWDNFDSSQWDLAMVFENFRKQRYWDWGAMQPAKTATQLSLLHDANNLYVRIVAQNSPVGNTLIMSKNTDDVERWPKPDHVEFYLVNKAGSYLFAVDGNGNQYDALNFDRRWNSGWRVKSRITEQGWETMAAIPLAALKYTKGASDDGLSIVIIRQAVSDKMNELTSLNGDVLGQRERVRLILD